MTLPPAALQARQMHSGLGGGNIGDELMARAFWDRLPANVRLDVRLAEESACQRDPYPPPHRYTVIGRRRTLPRRWWQALADPFHPQAGLIVGTTPVTEGEGLGMLLSVAKELSYFRRRGLPVDALGIGADHLHRDDARNLFTNHIVPAVRSWSVRSQPCRDALLHLGVSPENVLVGADWAWLYRQRSDQRQWAAQLWTSLGIDLTRPLLVANIVNLAWTHCTAAKQAIAAAFDQVAERHGLQIALFCNDFRPEEFMDHAAARHLATLMKRPPVIVPPLFYGADEALALLSFAQITVGQRYHFVVESVLAGTVPVAVPRMQKMSTLVAELGCPSSGRIDEVDAAHLAATIGDTLARRDAWLAHLGSVRRQLARRATLNLELIRRRPPWNRLAGYALPDAEIL